MFYMFELAGGNLPPNVGFPLHEDFDGSTYFLMELHYNNPNKDAGTVFILFYRT